MPDLLVRSVPESTRAWIEAERHAHNMKVHEFVVAALERVRQLNEVERFPLLAPVPAAQQAAPEPPAFAFIDLFAGVGGFRVALERVGGRCLFSCEWDKNAQRTYHAWFGDKPEGDIRAVSIEEIPDHDVLTAGFPCQPFSIAGVSKKRSLGRAHGFEDQTQGTLFFHLAKIIEEKRPPVALLENVKNLRSHDRGNTWRVIRETLIGLGYAVFAEVLDAAAWVPQHRERFYIVAFDREIFGDAPPFSFPCPPAGKVPRLSDILDEQVDPKYTLSDHLWRYLQRYAEGHRAKGNGFGFGLASLDGTTRTLSARYYKDGSEILVPQPGMNPRRLTPVECARLMGFGDQRPIVVSDTQAYRQFGNAVVPPVVEAVMRQIQKVMMWQLTRETGCLLARRRQHRRAGGEWHDRRQVPATSRPAEIAL